MKENTLCQMFSGSLQGMPEDRSYRGPCQLRMHVSHGWHCDPNTATTNDLQHHARPDRNPKTTRKRMSEKFFILVGSREYAAPGG